MTRQSRHRGRRWVVAPAVILLLAGAPATFAQPHTDVNGTGGRVTAAARTWHAVLEPPKGLALGRRLDDHADWRLEVVYARSSGATPNHAPVDQILRRLEEVRQNTPIETSGALLLAWSLLEAVVRRLEPEKAATGLSPGSMIELLLSLGYLVQSEASTLRASGQLRNAIAHGDLSVPGPAAVEVYRLLDIVEALVALLNRQEAPG